jgi:hypothetical protein
VLKLLGKVEQGDAMAWTSLVARASFLGFVVLTPQWAVCGAKAADAKFAIVSGGTLPRLGLNDEIQIRIIDGPTIQTNKVQLRLDGWTLGVEPRLLSPVKGEPILIFKLLRTDTNRPMWAQFLGSPFSKSLSAKNLVAVGVELDGKAAEARTPPQPDEAPEPKLDLIPYNPVLMIVGLFAAVAALVIAAWWSATTPMIRDGLVIPQIRLCDRPYSLGRTQMAFWSSLVLTSFLFILVVTQDMNSITAETFVLIGLSASTALGAIAIDQSKNDAATRVQQALDSMGIKTSTNVDDLYVQAGRDGTVVARNTVPGANIPQGLRAGLAAKANPTVNELLDEYRLQVKSYVSDGFLKDIVNDVNGPTIHRWQILIWTIILGAIYIWRIYSNIETPTFGANLLALMGISAGTYLGFKIPEKQA